MAKMESNPWRGSQLGLVYHLGNHAFGSDSKPNCAANEIAANTNAKMAMAVVTQQGGRDES